MITVLVANQMVALPVELKAKQRAIRTSPSGRIRKIRRTLQSDHPRRPCARTRGSRSRCMLTAEIRDTTNFTRKQQETRAFQSAEGMARTLRLITSWMVRHAAFLLSHFQAGDSDGKKAYARLFEKHYESLVLPFVEWIMWNDPTLQHAKR